MMICTPLFVFVFLLSTLYALSSCFAVSLAPLRARMPNSPPWVSVVPLVDPPVRIGTRLFIDTRDRCDLGANLTPRVDEVRSGPAGEARARKGEEDGELDTADRRRSDSRENEEGRKDMAGEMRAGSQREGLMYAGCVCWWAGLVMCPCREMVVAEGEKARELASSPPLPPTVTNGCRPEKP